MKLNDIANMLNVSPASISIVRNGKPGVSPTTRRQIQLALEQNGFTYKDYAVPGSALPTEAPSRLPHYIRLVKYNRSTLLTEKNEGFVDNIINAISAYARSEGYDLVLSAVQHTKFDDFLNEVKQELCSGLLVLATEMDRSEILKLRNINIPTVILDSDYPSLGIASVTMNNRALAYEAVSHLIGLGSKEVGYLCSNIRTGNCSNRENGYLEALRDHGIEWNKELVFPLTPSLSGACHDMLYHLSTNRTIPRALFADNDVIAVGAMQAMRQHGIKIPDDTYIVGVDNTMLAQVSSPTLSSMQISHSALGKKAIMLLLDQIVNPDYTPVQIYVDSKLTIRESSTQV